MPNPTYAIHYLIYHDLMVKIINKNKLLSFSLSLSYKSTWHVAILIVTIKLLLSSSSLIKKGKIAMSNL